MSLTVTSHFQSKIDSTNPSSLVTKFTFASSDLSGKVIEYHTISRDVTDVVGETWGLRLENASQTFNSLITNKEQFFKTGIFEFGFSTESGTNDVIQLFGGELTKAKFRETRVDLTFEDKLSALKKIKVGTKESPVSFVNTNVNPADLAFWVVTSFGGLSAVKSTSNPDINFTSWNNWFNIFDSNAIVVNAQFKGEKVTEILDKVQRVTDSTIYGEGDNSIYFNRWTGAGSDSITITDSHVSDFVPLSITGTEISNVVKVLHGFDVTSETWAGEATQTNSTSVGSYGTQEEIFDDELVFYANSASAFNLAERVAFRKSEPNIDIDVTTPLISLGVQLGDEIVFTSRVYSLTSRAFGLRAYEKDLEDKTVTLKLSEGFNRGGSRLHSFILDDSYWGKFDQLYNVLT